MNAEVLRMPETIVEESKPMTQVVDNDVQPRVKLETGQPTAEILAARGADLRRGSLVQVVSLKRSFLERSPKSKGTRKTRPGRAPGRDLSGADLLGAVGTIIESADTTRYALANTPDPLVLVRVGDEELYLNVSEIVPFETEPTRD